MNRLWRRGAALPTTRAHARFATSDVRQNPLSVPRQSTAGRLAANPIFDDKSTTGSSRSFLKSFLILVLFPTFVAFVYIAWIQTRQYVTEARFVVRSATETKPPASSDALSLLTKFSGMSSSKSTSQDGFIVTDYIRSRTIISDLGDKAFFGEMFSSKSIDYISRLADDASSEEVWKYWNQHVSATLDTISGVVTLQVRAFKPEDSVKVNRAILDLSERVVNAVSERSRNDAMKRAEMEVDRSREKLVEVKTQLLEYRNRNLLIDPVEKAKALGELIAKLTIKRIEIENNLSSLAGSLAKDSPSQRLTGNQLAVIDQQIADLQGQLTGTKDNPRVSTALSEFEQLKLFEIFTQRMYQIAQLSYDKARQEAAKQQLFLVRIVEPTLPEDPLVPKIGIDTFLFFIINGILWSIGSLLVASVRDHVE